MRSRKPVFRVLVLVAIFLAATLTPIAAVDAADESVSSEDLAKIIRWKSCYEDAGPSFECGSIRVPLDYDRPFGSTVKLEMVRLPASDQENRMGSILLNPGGPGGSGIDFALGFGPFVGFAYGPAVAAKFDIVGFDPRGISRSSPVRCFSNLDRAFAFGPPLAFPLFEDEIPLFDEAGRELARSCRRRGQARRVGSHTSTTNVARDMDVIRASLGEESMNFLGLSYGTYVAAVYANLFPDRVRAVVADGVIDPIAWVNEAGEVPISAAQRSDEGAQETLEEFFRQCDAAVGGNCALAPNSADRYAAVAERLLEAPIPLVDEDTGEDFFITYQDFIGTSLGLLYGAPGYPFLAELIAELEVPEPGTEGAAALTAARAALAVPPYENIVEGAPSVICVDSDNPKSYEAFFEAGVAADAEFGYFGSIWIWTEAACVDWPFVDRDRYEGPFTSETANPVLVVGNLYDPATRYEGAQTLRSLLPNSGLLTVDVPGHVSLGASVCADSVVGAYFLDPDVALEIDGFTCPQEYNAFDLFGGPPSDLGTERVTGMELRAEVMPHVGRVPAAVAKRD